MQTWKAKENCKADLHIKWTKAHGKAEHLEQGLITHEDFVGKAVADALAGVAADKAQVSFNDPTAVLWGKMRGVASGLRTKTWLAIVAVGVGLADGLSAVLGSSSFGLLS